MPKPFLNRDVKSLERNDLPGFLNTQLDFKVSTLEIARQSQRFTNRSLLYTKPCVKEKDKKYSELQSLVFFDDAEK